MDEDAIEQSRRRDAVWQRPSWPLHAWKANGQRRDRPFRDGFGFFAEETAEQQQQAGRFPPNSRQAKALRILELAPTAGLAEVKARYKALVKQLHPDITGGDNRAEERLKIINLAYSDLKAARSEEHTSELQSLMRISYAVFCLKKKTPNKQHSYT